jgi:hypothetical protein
MIQQVKDLAQDYEYTNGSYGFIKGVEHQKKENDIFAIKFAEWYSKENVMENTEKYFHYTMEDMLNEFEKEYYEGTL